MSILTRDAICAEVEKGRIVLDPFEPKNVGAASVDLRLSRFFRRFRRDGGAIRVAPEIDYRDPSITELAEVGDDDPSGRIEVPSGSSILGITLERVGLPDDVCGWFEGRSRFARLGLLVHISAGFMQPGTFNHQVLEISNFNPRPLSLVPGTPICQFIFQRTEGRAIHGGRYTDQTLEDFCATP